MTLVIQVEDEHVLQISYGTCIAAVSKPKTCFTISWVTLMRNEWIFTVSHQFGDMRCMLLRVKVCERYRDTSSYSKRTITRVQVLAIYFRTFSITNFLLTYMNHIVLTFYKVNMRLCFPRSPPELVYICCFNRAYPVPLRASGGAPENALLMALLLLVVCVCNGTSSN